MLSRASSEAIGGQGFGPGYKFERLVRYYQMQIAGLGANAAIAIQQIDWRFNLSGKSDRPAMAAARNLHSTVTDLARLRGWSTSVPFTQAT